MVKMCCSFAPVVTATVVLLNSSGSAKHSLKTDSQDILRDECQPLCAPGIASSTRDKKNSVTRAHERSKDQLTR